VAEVRDARIVLLIDVFQAVADVNVTRDTLFILE